MIATQLPAGEKQGPGNAVVDEARERPTVLDALRESEERFRGAFDHAGVGMAVADLDRRCLRVNAVLCDMLGYAEEDLVGTCFDTLTHPEDVEPGATLTRNVLAGEIDRYQVEKRYIHRDGSCVWVALNVALVRDAAGGPRYFVGQIQDITERKRSADALRASEARYQRHIANTPGVVYQYVTRPDGTRAFTVVSEGARRLFGIDPRAALADPSIVFGLVHPDDRPSFDQSHACAVRELTPWRWSGRALLPSGQERWVEVTSHPGLEPDGSVVCDGLLMDVTARRLAAVRMEASEQRYRSLFDRHPDAVASIDAEGRIESANPACQKVFGYEPGSLLGQPFTRVVAPDQVASELERFRQAMAGIAQSYETTIVHQSGRLVEIAVTTVPMVIGGAVSGVFAIIKDLTLQHSLEEQLRQAQKMEAVGRLAGGIAHDFNNLLTAILANAELALDELPDGPARQDVEAIRQTAGRAAGLTRQLLAFSRKQVIRPRLVDVNALISETERLLRRTLSEEIRVSLDLASAGAIVMADPCQLEQVVLNLAVNAGDAMPRGGELRIRTRTLEVDESIASAHPGLRAGDYVLVAVEDTGVGIAPELRSRIFEPFFTTKEVDRGTGLGLATVYGIVKQYGGYVTVDSEVGRGSTFSVYLPRREGCLASPPRATSRRSGPRGSETVLVVEDEPLVRASVLRILRLHGYTVLEAGHGVEALRVAAAAGQRIDLVMTDLIMPEMGGRELVAELRARGTDARILVMSGYDEQAALRGEPLPEGAGFLEKPFTMDALLEGVRFTLDMV